MSKYIIVIIFLISFSGLAQRVTHPRTSATRTIQMNNGYAYGVRSHNRWSSNTNSSVKWLRINLRLPTAWRRNPLNPTGGSNNNTGGSNNNTGGPNNNTGGPNNNTGGPNNNTGNSNTNAPTGGPNNNALGPNNNALGPNNNAPRPNNNTPRPNNNSNPTLR